MDERSRRSEAAGRSFVPERLNLAIGRRCFVSCPGCYSFFGEREPDLQRLHASIARFVSLGVVNVTLAGGDPLTIRGLISFLTKLREAGVRSIKLDTVGTALLETSPMRTIFSDAPALAQLLEVVDYLAIPLDGWSNETVGFFRSGRPRLYDETVKLLSAVDVQEPMPNVIINTVVHAMNFAGLDLIADEVLRHRAVCHWNIFQYSATDQALGQANADFSLDNKEFIATQIAWESGRHQGAIAQRIKVEFRSVQSRLGRYFLVNSDGIAWIPDRNGNTLILGSIFGREEKVLRAWRDAVLDLTKACHRQHDD